MLIPVLLAAMLNTTPKPKTVDQTGVRVDLFELGLKKPKPSWHCKHAIGTEYTCTNYRPADHKPAGK